MRKIILGLLILVCGLFLFMQTTSKAETDPERFECLETLTGHSSFVQSVTFSVDNQLLASGSNDGTIKIWDTSVWSEIKTLAGHSDDVECVAFSPNNQFFASSSRDESIKIWDTTDWSCIKTLTEHNGCVYCVAFSPDIQWLASGSTDNTIKIWDTSDWSEIKTLTGHSDRVINVDFSENNKWLASGSGWEDKSIKIWNTSDWSEIKTLTGHSSNVYSVDFSENNEWLASSSNSGIIKIWNTSDWSELKTLTGHSPDVYSIDFSENNEWLASGSEDDTIKIWDTSDWSELKTLTGHSADVYSVDFSVDNKWLASGSRDDTIKIWGEKEHDWIVTEQEIRSNETIILDGNLTIENGGNLTFNNVTLIINCSEDGEFGITVNEGGKFYILDYDDNPYTEYDRSNITANNTEYEFKFLVESDSEFVMKNSELSECGYEWYGDDGRTGLTIQTDNVIIENSSFYNNYLGIHLLSSKNSQIKYNNLFSNNFDGILLEFSSNNLITNNIISNNNMGIHLFLMNYWNQIVNNVITKNNWGILLSQSKNNQIINNNISHNEIGIYLKDGSRDNKILNSTISESIEYDFYLKEISNITVVNTTFNKNKVYFEDEESELFVKWYLNIKIIDKNSTPIQNANVRIKDNENGDFDENFTTYSNGFVNWINLTEYIENKDDKKIYYTPYNITAEKDSLKKSREIEIDDSKEIIIVLREDNHWIVNKTEIRINETIILDGNLTIENGGNLTFRNVTLIMNCFEDGEFGIK